MRNKEFAKSRELTMAKLKELSLNLIGEFPSEFSDDQVAILDNALTQSSQALMAQSFDSKGDNGTIQTTAEALEAQIIQDTTRIVGEEELKKNAILYLNYLKTNLAKSKLEIETQLFRIEQKYYDELRHYQHTLYEDGKRRTAVNAPKLINFFSSETLKKDLENNPQSEDETLLTGALEFLEALGL